MDKKACFNSTIEQTLDTVNFALEVGDSLSFRKLRDVLSASEIKKVQRIIITGCGDSWLAGIAMRPAIEALTGIETKSMRCIDFSRYYSTEKLEKAGEQLLVIGISISGAVSRVIEAMERGTHYGVLTLAITNNPNGPMALASKRCLMLDMPPLERTPGVSSYIASTSALLQLALRISKVKEKLCDEYVSKHRTALASYYKSFTDVLPELDQQMFEVSKTWKDLKAYDFVGDEADYATAFFGSAKFIEAFGGVCTYDDSEDWNHINFFLREPEKIGTVVIANSETPSFDRIQETIRTMVKIGRPLIVITDAEKSEFPDGALILTLPDCEYGFMKPIMQHLPLDLLCAYIMAQLGTTPYREDERQYDELPVHKSTKHSPRRLI